MGSKRSSAKVNLSATHQSRQRWPGSAYSYRRVFSKRSLAGHCILCKKAAIAEWRGSKGDIAFCFGNVVYEVFKGYFLGADIQTGRERERETAGEREAGKGREGGVGYRCLCMSLNMEPLCTNFLLSIWKVGSRQSVFSPCWCVLMWALPACRLWRPLLFRQEGGGLLRQHRKGRGETRKGPW